MASQKAELGSIREAAQRPCHVATSQMKPAQARGSASGLARLPMPSASQAPAELGLCLNRLALKIFCQE
jgi:hypothetical protein